LKKIFRILVVTSMVIYAVFWFLPYFTYLWTTTEVLNLLSFNGYGRLVQFPVLVEWALLFTWLLVSIGLITFNRSARNQFIVLNILSLVLIPLSGLIILSPMEALLFSIVGILDGAIISMFYFSPVAQEFNKPLQTSIED